MDSRHICNAEFEVLLPLEHLSEGESDGVCFQCARCDLVQQRLEGVVVITVEQQHLHLFVLQLFCYFNASKPSTDDHNTGKPVFSRSEEHTSELQSRENLVCRLLLEKKKKRVIRLSMYMSTP